MVICLCTNLQVTYSGEIIPEYGGRGLWVGRQLGWKPVWWSWSKWWCSMCPKDSSSSCANIWAALHPPPAYPKPSWDHSSTCLVLLGLRRSVLDFHHICLCLLYNIEYTSSKAQQWWPATCGNQTVQFICF